MAVSLPALSAPVVAHVRTLAVVCASLLVGVLFACGTVLPRLSSSPEFAGVHSPSRWAGFILTFVLCSGFASAYLFSPAKGENERRMGYVVAWFVGSLFFDVVWEIPLWTTNVASVPRTADHLPYMIYWWAYGLSDTLYEEVTPLMITFEIWWLLGNLFGLAGLLCYRSGKSQEALLLFVMCGSMQAYNASVYVFMAIYVDHFETIAPNFKSHVIFWGLNGFWGVASTVAAYFSYAMLVGTFDVPSLRRGASAHRAQ